MKNFFLIGLTGNLGSGKSTVRKMLEPMGARGIDADYLARYALARGTAPWFSAIELLGWDIVKFNGEIDRAKVGGRVFANPDALSQLEAIVHPAVATLIQETLRQANEPIIVVEAVKLIEAGLHHWCDAVWIVQCAPEVELQRVMRDRHMSEADARARLAAQGSLDNKLPLANVVIDNSGDEAATRAQVQRAWDAIQPQAAKDKNTWLFVFQSAPNAAPAKEESIAKTKSIAIVAEKPAPTATPIEARRASRRDLDALGKALMKKENRAEPFARDELLKRFGERGYRVAVANDKIVALAGWEAENLVATVREVWAESDRVALEAVPKLIALIEGEARELSCEMILLLLEERAAANVRDQTVTLGYQERTLKALHPTWRQVVKDRLQPGDQIWVKRLRDQLVTSPI